MTEVRPVYEGEDVELGHPRSPESYDGPPEPVWGGGGRVGVDRNPYRRVDWPLYSTYLFRRTTPTYMASRHPWFPLSVSSRRGSTPTPTLIPHPQWWRELPEFEEEERSVRTLRPCAAQPRPPVSYVDTQSLPVCGHRAGPGLPGTTPPPPPSGI